MNDKASLAFGDSNMIRHNEVEILEVIRQRRMSIINVLTHAYSPVGNRQARVRSDHFPLV